MTNEQFKKDSLERFTNLASIKFDAGQLQHGGMLWQKKDLVYKAKEEVIDMWFYLDSLQKQIEDKTVYEVSEDDIDL